MPVSRPRRTHRDRRRNNPRVSGDPRRYGRRPSARHSKYDGAKLDRISDIELLLTDADKEHMVLSMEAAAAGDAALALEHELAVSVLPGGPSAALLREVVVLGEDAPGWVWSRWILHQSYRWLLVRQDDTVDQAVRATISALHGAVMVGLNEPEDLFDLGTRVAAADWVAQELAVHELGAVPRFLAEQAGDVLKTRADRIDRWVGAEMGGYRLERTRGAALEVTDLASGDALDVLNIGALSERFDGEFVVGRIVPISVEPYRMFAARPLSVDPVTAEQVAVATCSQDGKPWLHVLSEACDDGRLGPGFSVGHGTLLSSDLPLHWAPSPSDDEPESGAPRFQELVADGLSAAAANGVMVCELGLVLRDVSPEGLDRFATHLSAVLLEPEVVRAVRRLLCDALHRDFWEDMAERVPEPIRSRCREFAALCA